MKKYILFIFILALGNLCFAENKPKTLMDLNGLRKIKYHELQKPITKSNYNIFESIYVDYPELIAGNKGIAIDKINAFMKSKALDEIKLESFKYEFLPFAYKALASRLGVNISDNWQRYSLKTGSPTLSDIETKLLFLSGDILAYQVQYNFFFEPHAQIKLGGFSYVKTYYLQASSGKQISLSDLIAPAKWNALVKQLEQELNRLLKENEDFLNSFQWEKEGELKYDQDMNTGEEEDEPKELKKIQLLPLDMENMYLNLTPFSAQFILPPFYSSFDQFKQLGLVVNLSIEEFSGFLSKSKPLGFGQHPKAGNSKPLRNIHILNKQREGYFQLISPLQEESNFVTQAPKNARCQELYSAQISKTDTQLTLLRRTTYDKVGRIIKHASGSEEIPESWQYFEYDSNNNVVKEVQYAYHEIKEYKTFTFDARNCLESYTTMTDGEEPQVFHYYYRDSFVFECKTLNIFQDMEEVDASLVRVFALDSYGNIVSNYLLSQSPEYISRYHQNKLMASYSLNYPNLDNYIFAYNRDGNLESIISDNGRRLHTFIYKQMQLQTYMHHDSYNLQEKRDFFYDEKSRLCSFREIGRYGNATQTYMVKYQFYE